MFKLLWRFFLLSLLVLPTLLVYIDKDSGTHILVGAQEADLTEDEDDEGQVETEDEATEAVPPGQDSVVVADTDEDEEEDEEKPLKPSPDAETTILFVSPNSLDLPAGKLVELLVGFRNKGSKDFILETLDASFRYPMDFSFYIQNFSTIHYSRVVKPAHQVTLAYNFVPNEAFSARPFGLTVNLIYKDTDGNMFMEGVFNSTVNIVEIEDGLDGETFFLYIFLAACAVLILVTGQQFLYSFGRKRPAKKQQVEMGTSNRNDVDYDWLPERTLNEIHKSPKRSPRQRRTKRQTGSDD